MNTTHESHGQPARPLIRAAHARAPDLPIPRDLTLLGFPPRKCSAHRSDGRPCRRWATRGATVCRSHGAGSPKVKRAAQQRIADAVANRYAAQFLLTHPAPEVDGLTWRERAS